MELHQNNIEKKCQIFSEVGRNDYSKFMLSLMSLVFIVDKLHRKSKKILYYCKNDYKHWIYSNCID